jgi:hypothetical protein
MQGYSLVVTALVTALLTAKLKNEYGIDEETERVIVFFF